MRPDRLVDTFRRMEQTLKERNGDVVREPGRGGDAAVPSALGKRHPVRRMLRRVGVVHARKAGKKACDEVEEAAWAIAESADLSVTEVARTWIAFAGDAPDGQPPGVCVDQPKCEQCQVGENCRHYVKKAPTIKDMPEHERPRERLLALGHQAVSDAELLALLIGGGREEATAIDLAHTILAKAGGLKQLAVLTAAELCETSGIGARQRMT